jgi:hypothetical protein
MFIIGINAANRTLNYVRKIDTSVQLNIPFDWTVAKILDKHNHISWLSLSL